MGRLAYIGRVLSSYVFSKNSQLTFWHDIPDINPQAFTKELGQYYMTFKQKAAYPGPFDKEEIPLLNYHGKVGIQYNPIAIAQYALGNYNLFGQTDKKIYQERFLKSASWLLNNISVTNCNMYLWPHNFDFEYFRPLKAPWFSGLAQGQGLSVLIRAYGQTGNSRYLQMAEEVFRTLSIPIDKGGVQYKDSDGFIWIEEYLVDPPTHILNGFIWALWGIYDYFLFTRSKAAKDIFDDYVRTILHYLDRYDISFWSLYELTPQRLKSVASPFYHQIHIVQMDIMHRLTGYKEFLEYSEKWTEYSKCLSCRFIAGAYKSLFKIIFY